MDKAYLINEVSKRVGLSQKRIREYEREGFIKPRRHPTTNNRLYSEFDISQVKRINFLIHKKGFTVSCLRSLLAMAPCWNIFGCRLRERCAAYKNPTRLCWDVRNDIQTLCPGPCGRCAVYLNRGSDSGRVLESMEEQGPMEEGA